MKHYIKKKLRNLMGVPEILDNTQKNLWKNAETEALLWLQGLAPIASFYPVTSWSISPVVIMHVLNDILINKRENIIEFGSGLSTLYIAKLLKAHKLNAKFISVDSSQEWLEVIQKNLEAEQLNDYVELIEAPISEDGLGLEGNKKWYSVSHLNDKLKKMHQVDLVLVDGPASPIASTVRYGALPYLQNKLAQDYSIYLDDSNRVGEKQILQAWEKLTQAKFNHHFRYAFQTKGNSFETLPSVLKLIK